MPEVRVFEVGPQNAAPISLGRILAVVVDRG